MQYENVESQWSAREISPGVLSWRKQDPPHRSTNVRERRERRGDFGVISQTNDAIKRQNKKKKQKKGKRKKRVFVCVYHVMRFVLKKNPKLKNPVILKEKKKSKL